MNWKQRILCTLGFHDYRPGYAKDRQPGRYTRQYTDDRPDVQVDGCVLVDQCTRCGAEGREMLAPARVADESGLWRDSE